MLGPQYLEIVCRALLQQDAAVLLSGVPKRRDHCKQALWGCRVRGKMQFTIRPKPVFHSRPDIQLIKLARNLGKLLVGQIADTLANRKSFNTFAYLVDLDKLGNI
jgi:hypothetical protein